MKLRLLRLIAGLGLAMALQTRAEIYTFADFTRTAGGASTTSTHDFSPNEGWSGTPPNSTGAADTTPIYLTATVSWTATATANQNIGTFNIRFNRADDAGQARIGMGKTGGVSGGQNAGFEFITGNGTSDPDGSGPATARPAIVPFDPSAVTSVTLVMKVDHSKAGTSPGGDWWFGDPGLQSSAVGVMWINPNLAAAEAGQFTPWAAWRSGNDGYQGVSFITDTDAVDLHFSNIALYTEGDSPFSTGGGGVDPATSTVSASPAAVPADGTTTSAITVTLKDSGGNPVAGKQVSLSGNGSATIETANDVSDASGVVTFTVKSGTVGLETFTATDVTDSLVITQTAGVDFQPVVVVGPVDAGQSGVVASPTAVPANGITPSTVTVTLRDANGLPVVGEDVTLGGSPSGASISPSATQTTNGSGQAAFTVSSATIGTVVFTAVSSTDNVTVTQTASVEFTDPALAQSFNVKFLEDNPPQANVTGLVGVVGEPGETWNQGYTSVSNLIDTSGTVVSSVGVSGLGNDGRLISGTSLGLFSSNRGFFGKGQDTTIQITGLTPDTPYDLYIYSLSHNTGSWGDVSNTERAAGDFVTTNTVLANGQSQWLDNAVAGTNGNAFVPNGNYVSFQSIVADGSGNISIVADAYDGVDGNSSTNDGDCRLQVCGLQIRPASGMSIDYMSWRSTYHPGLGLPDEDDDGDGLSNDFERIFGLDPTDSASANPYSNPFDPATGSFGYTRRSQALANLNYKVWYSTDLQNWLVDNAASQTTGSVADGVEMMGVEIDPALLVEPRLFVQVRATPITGIDLEPSRLNVRGSGNTITLLFSEPMNPSSASNPARYSVVRDGVGPVGITNVGVSADGASVTLTLDSALGLDTGYTVGIDGVNSGTGQSLNGISRPFRTWDDDPAGVKVFILAGQSNMVGRGESERGNGDVNGAIGSLRYEVVNDNANYGQLVVDSGNPATDPWVVRSDVKFWWNRADIGGGASISKGGLKPQGFGSGPSTFGPEYGFGWAVGDAIFQPVLVIKTAWGGKDLIANFRPPSAVAARGGVVGGYYIEMVEQVREVLHNLGTQFPEWSGLGYQIAGFGWHQGWNDSLSTFAANEYEANMANFITDVRAEFGKPNLPFSIGTTGMDGVDPDPEPVDRVKVVNAQINVANPSLHPELGGNVFTVDTRPFAETTANSPTDDTTHWKNNGKSMYRIGKGMGDGMVGLLPP